MHKTTWKPISGLLTQPYDSKETLCFGNIPTNHKIKVEISQIRRRNINGLKGQQLQSHRGEKALEKL